MKHKYKGSCAYDDTWKPRYDVGSDAGVMRYFWFSIVGAI